MFRAGASTWIQDVPISAEGIRRGMAKPALKGTVLSGLFAAAWRSCFESSFRFGATRSALPGIGEGNPIIVVNPAG